MRWRSTASHRLTVGAAVALAACLLSACGASGGVEQSGEAVDPQAKTVGKSTMAADWPLTADEGVLRCEGSGGVGQVTIEVDGIKYAVNGSAKGDKSNAPIDPIWAEDTTPGLKKSIGPLIQEGLALCK